MENKNDRAIDINTLPVKKVLSPIRKGDYAHVGEDQAILRAFLSLPKNPDALLLDVGCGLGGTADFLRSKGYGNVTGAVYRFVHQAFSSLFRLIRKGYLGGATIYGVPQQDDVQL